MKPTLKGKAKSVVSAWDAFLKDPANKLSFVAKAIEELGAAIKEEERKQNDKQQLKLFK